MILKNHDTNFVQFPPNTEARLVAEREDAINWHRRSIATRFYLSLFADERVDFSFCWFHFWPPNPAKLKQSMQQLPKEMKSRIIFISNDDFRTKTTQSLPNWRTRGNCRKDGAHKILKEATRVFAELFSEEATIFFQWTITDGSLPRNAPLRWLQSTNDSGACTPPTFQWRANGYSVSPFAANNTQIGRTPQMPDGHNQQAQSPFQWSCVQLNQHRQWPQNDGT